MRLIDADAERERLKKRYCEECTRKGNYGIFGAACTPCWVKDAIEEFDNAQEVKAEPVRHGKLLEGKTFNDQHCSVCGQRFLDNIRFILPSDENGFPMPKRCPECGCYWDGCADNG